jgi:hypothetical protein
MKHPFLKRALPITLLLAAVQILASPLSFADRKDGTKDGSGGDVESSRVTKHEILAALKDSFLDVSYNLIRAREKADGDSPEEIFLRERYTKLAAAMSKVRVRARMTLPCENSKGEYRDGSASVSGNTICISLKTLAEKLSKESYHKKVRQLILHEVSHLAGADEAMARRIEWLGYHDDFFSGKVQDLVNHMESARWQREMSFFRSKGGSPGRQREIGEIYSATGGVEVAYFTNPGSPFEGFVPTHTRLPLLELGHEARVIMAALQLRACEDMQIDPIAASTMGICEVEPTSVNRDQYQSEVKALAEKVGSSEEWRRQVDRLEEIVPELERVARRTLGENYFKVELWKETAKSCRAMKLRYDGKGGCCEAYTTKRVVHGNEHEINLCR